MALREIQKEVNNWIHKQTFGYFKPLEILAQMIEEVGEVAREINHRFGPKKKKKTELKGDLGAELADIMFTIVCLANSLNINLDKEFGKVMKKLNTRDKDRWKKK